MDKFLRSIKQNLERRQGPPFREEAWLSMQEKLQNPDRDPKKRFGFFWLLPFLFLGLLGSMALNYWFYRQGKISKEHLVENTLTIQKDTIYQTNVIIQTDTIYRDRVIYKYNNNTTNKASTLLAALLSDADLKKWKKNFEASNSPASQFLDFDTQKKDYIAYHLNQTLENQDFRIKEKFTGIDLANARLQDLQLLDLKEFPLKDDLDDLVMKDIPQKKQKKLNLQRLVYRMKPKSFFAGANIARVLPADKDINKQLKEHYLLSYSLAAELAYNDRFRLFGEANYLSFEFQSKTMADIFGAPPIRPPNDDFVFDYVEVPLSMFQYTLGLKYFLRPKKQLKPFMAAGVSAITILPYELTYEFKNEKGFESYIDKEDRGKEFHTNYLFLKTGFEMNVYRNWNWQVDLWYRRKVGQQPKHTFNVLGLNTGLIYQF